MPKVSVVVTVLNEKNSIADLLDAFDKQTKKNVEYIFTDGGSVDGTGKIIDKWIRRGRNRKFFKLDSANIASGRNKGIRESSGCIIVNTDAGCIPHHDWLEKIVRPFRNKSIDVVSGFYKMQTKSFLEECFALYLGVIPEKLKKTFIPSARSMAYRDYVWKKAGGFPEYLKDAGEDTLFIFKAMRLGFKIYFAKDALVDWPIVSNIGSFFKKVFRYAYGDAQSKIYWDPEKRFLTHFPKIVLIFLRYTLGLVVFINYLFTGRKVWLFSLISLFCLYFFWAIAKNYNFVKKPAVIYLPLVQVISDLAVITGFVCGFISL